MTGPSPASTIRFDAVRSFLTDQAWPFWSTLGAYPNGCFVECLDLSGRPVDPGFTRVRVQARQIYVFSHAHQTGLFEAADLCQRATAFFVSSAWLGPDLGWAKLIRRDGSVIDASTDLYDTSFALFALAWAFRIDPQERYLTIAHATLDHLAANMAHASGGFENDAKHSRPRLQNPHMHLVEALNAWFEASGDMRFCTLAGGLVDLAAEAFSDPGTGALGEYFEDDWTPIEGPKGSIVEPGHQFEWAWIIAHFGRLSGQPRPQVVERLLRSAHRHGYDRATGLTVDEVSRTGEILSASHRLWPQTEALKGFVAAAEFLGHSTQCEIATTLDAIFRLFLAPAPVPGTWIDHFHPDWTPKVDKIPATSLYHITLAFLELLRQREALERTGSLRSNDMDDPL